MEGAMFLAGMALAIVFMFACAIAWWTPSSVWQSSAIERGFGLYCPNNGNFAWIGECE